MKKLTNLILVVALISSFSSLACGSFRLADGNLVSCGMERSELLVLLGQPISKDTESLGLNTSPGKLGFDNGSGKTIETWSYVIQGSIGGDYILAIRISDGKIISLSSKQKKRF